jgi:hypothetical protein
MPHLNPVTWVLIAVATLALVWVVWEIWFGLTQAR